MFLVKMINQRLIGFQFDPLFLRVKLIEINEEDFESFSLSTRQKKERP